jgi:hypothetical protein
MPDGEVVVFNVVESPVVAAGLAAKYPEIKTYKVTGIDDPHASGRIGITPLGLYGMIHTSAGVIYLDPEEPLAQIPVYRSRSKGKVPLEKFSCGVHDAQHPVDESVNLGTRTASRMPGNLLEYDLAVAATFEYYQFFGSSIVNTMSAITMTIMRVNTIYERDLGITLKLVADNDNIIETDVNGPLNNDNTEVLLSQTENWIDSNLPGGDAAYDIGHMFSVPRFVGGGLAFLGVVCDNDLKANGVTGFPNPAAGDPYDIDFVAHEIGHQFNADHSFNGTTNSCATGRNYATAFEPGSGSSVMAYAGICGQENLQTNSDATFHAGSIEQIDSFTRGEGNCANTVAVLVGSPPVSNSDPAIAAISNKIIPANTPFILKAEEATDADNVPLPTQTLSYQWDQMDVGCPTNSTSFGTDIGSNTLFRSYVPRGETWRNFPALGTQVRGRFDKAEVLPCNNRDLDFRLTARDGSSGQDTEDLRVSVTSDAGPFEITNLNPPVPTIFAGTPFAVNWDVANTNLPPVNCATVDFDLISFATGYASYTILPLVAADDSNDGSEFVTLDPLTANPNSTPHTLSRVRVKCRDNIFYDISDTDLRVEGDMVSADNSIIDTEFTTYSFVTPGIAMATVAPACGVPVECAPPAISGRSAGRSSGAIDYLWLLLMAGIVALVKCYRRYGLQ